MSPNVSDLVEDRMDTLQNAPLTPRGRDACPRCGGPRAVQSRCGAPVQHNAKDRRQMGRSLPGRRSRGLAGPLIKALSRLPRNGAGHMRSRRGFATAAPHGYRSPSRLACQRRPSAVTCGAWASTDSSALEPAEPIRRYERANPGELIHIDIKKLGWTPGRPSDDRTEKPAQSTVISASAGSSCTSV